MKTKKISFSLSKIDDINLRKYDIALKNYKTKIKSLTELLVDFPELKKSDVFSDSISKIRFDVSFCSDSTIQQINKDYRKKDKPTDVITFSLFYDDKQRLIYRKTADLGQIIISIETANKQKDENKNTLEKEIMTLVAHGFLHLIGFDHLEKRDYDFVVGVQKKVLRKLYE